MNTIFVPSKGRPESKLLHWLSEEGLPHCIVVEPQDFEAYKKFYLEGNLKVLHENDKGMAYVRNAILNTARATGLYSFWMLDDDINAFGKGTPEGYVYSMVRPALEAADILLEGFAQGALEYSQFAWSAQPGDHSDGGYCDVCVRIEPARVKGLAYREEVNLKEDRDFTLQVLASGERTRRISHIGFSCPENGSNKGGLYDEYKAGREEAAAEALARLWPHCVTVRQKKNGRIDAKIDWRSVRQSRMFV